MNTVYLSLGSNLGDRLFYINKSIELLKLCGIKINKISNFYITSPMYYTNQPYFINAVLEGMFNGSAYELLNVINKIENKLKRKRVFKNSPRTIDIDILYFNNEIINDKKLTVPHPKLYERKFVLVPFMDVSHSFVDPVRKLNISDILSELKDDNQIIIKVPENYKQSLEFLLSLNPRKKTDFTTFYIKETLKSLDNPQLNLNNVIHITGSAGKTSTAVYISSLLKKLGFKVGLYISPHIIDIRERISINNRQIPRKDFFLILKRIISNAKYVHSVFEYITLIAILYFSKKTLDYSVIEVGMGGKNDATNVFEKSHSVFTRITKEHQKYLGKNIKDITLNKCGIIKKHSKVFVSGSNAPEVISAIRKYVAETESNLYIYNEDLKHPEEYNLNFSKFIVSVITGKKTDDLKLKIPCRYEVRKINGIKILFDGAHTDISIKLLIDNIPDGYENCLMSFMNDKRIDKMISTVIKSGKFKNIVLTDSTSYRSFNPLKYSKLKGVKVIKSYKKAVSYLIGKRKNFVVTGSLYFCRDVMLFLFNSDKNHYNFKELY